MHRAGSACVVLACILAAAGAACTTERTTLAAKIPVSASSLGAAHGEACSSVVPWAGALQSIPISTASRFERAYQNALASVPGATALAGVTFQEHWYWAVFGTVYCTTITGEGVR